VPHRPEKFKEDPRSPQELAKAILDHPLTPRGQEPYSVSFRERLLLDDDTQYQAQHPVLSAHGSPLAFTLKACEEGASLGRTDKRRLSHALQVIDAFKNRAAEIREDSARQVAATPVALHNAYHRGEAESMEDCLVEIIHLNAIEQLVRALAHKLGVTLIEPGRRK
jgi:hypothetical protein